MFKDVPKALVIMCRPGAVAQWLASWFHNLWTLFQFPVLTCYSFTHYHGPCLPVSGVKLSDPSIYLESCIFEYCRINITLYTVKHANNLQGWEHAVKPI